MLIVCFQLLRNRANVPLIRQCGCHTLFLSSAVGRPPSIYACREVYHLYRIFAAGFQFGSKEGNRPRPKENPVDRGIDQRVGEGGVVGRSLFLRIGWLCLGHSVALPGTVEGISAVAITDLRDEDGFVDLDRQLVQELADMLAPEPGQRGRIEALGSVRQRNIDRDPDHVQQGVFEPGRQGFVER